MWRSEPPARAVQDGLRARTVLDEPGPPPGTGRVTGVDVAYDDERDVVFRGYLTIMRPVR